MADPLTSSLGAFIADLTLARIPPAALDVVHTGMADCVATMIAGSIEDAPQILYRTLEPPAGGASLYLTGPRVPAPEAALINGTAAPAVDFGDVALRGHPSPVLVPAILAEGEVIKASGAQLALAYVAGYEVWAELAGRDPMHHHQKGWHPTGIFGPIGAAAACAALRGLDRGKAAVAVAPGAFHNAGPMGELCTSAKPDHGRLAAPAGARAPSR